MHGMHGKTVTIDIDFDTISDLELEIALQRFRYICAAAYECSICFTEHGIHLYIVLNRAVSFGKIMMLRAYLFDDDNRLEIDMKRRKYQQVMFKWKHRKGKKYSREWICYSLASST